MAKFTLKGVQSSLEGAQSTVGGVTGKYSTNVLAALLDDTNLLDITKNKELQNLILKTSGKLLSLIKIPDDSPIKSAFPKNTLSEEEKLYDKDGDGELNKQETKAKLIGDLKSQLETTVLSKFNLKVDEITEFAKATDEQRDELLKNYIQNNPKYQAVSGSIDTQIKLYSSIIKKQLDAGRELFTLIKSDDRVYVEGIIVNELTGEPIKGAKVEFSSPNHPIPERNFTDTTNRKGKFIIEIPKLEPKQAPLEPMVELTDIQKAQIIDAANVLNGTWNGNISPNQTSSNFQFDNLSTPTTNNPILITFSGSVYIPEPLTDEPDDPVVQTTLTGSDTGSISPTSSAVPNPIFQPDLSGYTLYSSKDENGTPTQPLYSGVTDLSGSFNFSIPKDIEYISLSKGSGTNIVLITTFNSSELNFDEAGYIEIPNPQSDETTLSNTELETSNNPIPQLAEDTITVTATDYASTNIVPYKGDGKIKEKLIFKLTPTKIALEKEIRESKIPKKTVIQEVTKTKKDAKWYQNEKLAKVSRELESTMLPIILTMAASFGVSQLEKKIKSKKSEIEKEISCPTTIEGQAAQDVIIKIINKKNKLVKQLNNTLTIIDNTTKALGIAGTSIEIMNASYMVLKNIPIPSSTGVPGVPGIPINVINTIEDTKIKIEKLIATLRGFNIGILATLVVLRQTLIKIIALLRALDIMIEFCSPDSAQETISAELLALTIQQTEQTSPVVTNVNGFEMGVVTEPTTNPLKRRRAIATNKSGVVMLQGEWSFSSIDQILIDELVFYIQVNNLKAD
jgi:hypothetical protein